MASRCARWLSRYNQVKAGLYPQQGYIQVKAVYLLLSGLNSFTLGTLAGQASRLGRPQLGVTLNAHLGSTHALYLGLIFRVHWLTINIDYFYQSSIQALASHNLGSLSMRTCVAFMHYILGLAFDLGCTGGPSALLTFIRVAFMHWLTISVAYLYQSSMLACT